MENGELLAALLIPEGFVQDIMSGVNTPVPVLLPENAGVESRIFKGAGRCRGADLKRRPGRDLRRGRGPGPFSLLRGQSTAGAGSEPPVSEYSLPAVSCSENGGERLGGCKAGGLFMPSAFSSWPLCCQPSLFRAFSSPLDPVLRRQLLLAGVGPVSMILSRILGLALLYMVLLLSAASAAVLTGAIPFFLRASRSASALKRFCVLPGCMRLPGGGEPDGRRTFPVPGSHSAALFSGGILPLVFLPSAFQKAAPFLPPLYFH